MDTIILYPENKEQIIALKASLNGFKIRFEANKENEKTDFSDIIGKLSWAGDALAVQKRLRSEWD
jgi:hypothetical protein